MNNIGCGFNLGRGWNTKNQDSIINNLTKLIFGYVSKMYKMFGKAYGQRVCLKGHYNYLMYFFGIYKLLIWKGGSEGGFSRREV